MRKRCKLCGAYLDPGEWCDCEDNTAQEMERPRLVKARKRTPHESDDAGYIDRYMQSVAKR